MSEIWVANASPIIVLAKAGYLRLLNELPDELLVPEPVAVEILAGPESDPARLALEQGWGPRIEPAAIAQDLLEWGLGPGETAVLAVARERPGSIAILDDAAARSCAKTGNSRHCHASQETWSGGERGGSADGRSQCRTSS